MTDRDAALPDETTAAALVRLLGYPPLDAETAARIAAGAARTVAAVHAMATVPLIDVEPGGFLAELERLAGPGP
jgi:hypothetical protein